MQGRQRMVVGLVAIAAGATVVWWHGRDHAPGPMAAPAAVHAPSRPPNPAPAPAVRSTDSAADSRRPQPSSLSSLGVDDLRRRADAGDAAASCWLAVEWNNCRSVQSRLGAVEHLLDERQFERWSEKMPAEVREKLMAQRVEKLPLIQQEAESLLVEAARCDSIPPADDRSIIHRWRQGALGGNVVAMRHYAIGEAFRSTKYMDFLPELLLYRRDAEAIALRAVEAGDLKTAVALAHAYGMKVPDGNGGLLNEVVEYQPVRALALYRRVQAALPAGATRARLESVMAPQIDRLLADMTPEQRGEAESQARQARPLSNPDNDVPSPMLMRGMTGNVAPGQCDGSDPRPLSRLINTFQ